MIRPSPVARRAVLAASLALLASPAFARSAKKEKKGAKEGEGEEAADPVIKLQSMALPIIADGKLVNYVFVQMTITLKDGVPSRLTSMSAAPPSTRGHPARLSSTVDCGLSALIPKTV